MPIFKQPNGKSWRVIVQESGRRRSKVCATLKEAKRVEALLMIELGQQPDLSEGTLETLIDLHLAASDKRAVTTIEDYRYLLAKVPQWLMDWRVANVTPMMLDQAYKRLLKETWKIDGKTEGPLSTHRLRRLHGIIRPAFDLAVIYGWVTINPATAIRPPVPPESQVAAPNAADVIALLKHADAVSPSFGAALRVVAATGCRRGELCALQWNDIDLEAGSIAIRRSLSTTTAGPRTITAGKTGKKGHRVVAVGPSVVAALIAHRARQNTDRLAKGVGRTEWVFANEAGEPWRTDYVTLLFTRLRDELDIDMHLHQLRHKAATDLLAAGVDLKTVSGRLGHSRVSTTVDMYGHVIPARDREAADIMERSLGS